MGYYGAQPGLNERLETDLDMNSNNITGTGDIKVSGKLQGGVDVQTHTAATIALVADDDCYGTIHQATKSDGGQEFDLPPVVVGMFLTIECREAQVVTIDPDDNDRIILGTSAKADGVAITSGGAGGEIITLYGESADGWKVIGIDGGWS